MISWIYNKRQGKTRMKTQKVYLDYLPEYDTYGISDEKIKQLTEAGITPILELSPEDAQKISEKQKNSKKQPTIVFLMGREKGHYTIDRAYVQALSQTGAKLRFLTFEENLAQMNDIDGLVLPGGAFDSPNEFYTAPEKNILCIQWHPEDFAAKGNKKMQGIYNWLFTKAKEHQQKQQMNNMINHQMKNFFSWLK